MPGPDARRRAVIEISCPPRAAEPDTTQRPPGTRSVAELLAEEAAQGAPEQGMPRLPGTRMFLHRDQTGRWQLVDAEGWPADYRFTRESDPSGGVTIRSMELAALWRYDADRRLREAQFPLTSLTGEELDPDLRGLTVREVRTPGTDGAPGNRHLEILGSSTAPGTRFTIAPLRGEPIAPLGGEVTERLPGGFTLTDPRTGRSWNVDSDGRAALDAGTAPSDTHGFTVTPRHPR